VEDALGLGSGKLRLFAGRYRRSQGTEAHGFHFLDLADARVVFDALAHGEQGFSYKEYKGTPPQNGRSAVSRVLSITVKGENVYIELKTGPGKLTNTGAITPNGPAKVEVNVGFKLYEARRMAASALAYIRAWDVMRMMVNRHLVSQPTPYLLVAATSEANGVQSEPAKPENGTSKSPAAAANNGRPVTRKDPMPNERLLQYGDGHMVDGHNLTEVQTFQRYVTEKNTTPESKAGLLDYYRQRAQVPASAASQ
jgi:hypothetical protein